MFVYQELFGKYFPSQMLANNCYLNARGDFKCSFKKIFFQKYILNKLLNFIDNQNRYELNDIANTEKTSDLEKK